MAAGLYVKKDGAGDDLVVSNGNFTADAELTANFGGDTIAVANQNSVSGTIFGFTDGSEDLGFADLTLEKSAQFTQGSLGTAITGKTNGGGATGDWRATFYGTTNGGTGDNDATDDYPANIAGEFNGHFVNGHVAGAFGAEKDWGFGHSLTSLAPRDSGCAGLLSDR